MTAADWIRARRDHEGKGRRLHHSDYDRSLDALEEVLNLHLPVVAETTEDGQIIEVCGKCYEIALNAHDEAFDVDHYWPVQFPCPTVAAIEAVLGIEAGESR